MRLTCPGAEWCDATAPRGAVRSPLASLDSSTPWCGAQVRSCGARRVSRSRSRAVARPPHSAGLSRSRYALVHGAAAGLLIALVALQGSAGAQSFTRRGLVDAQVLVFPQDTPNDRANFVGDLLIREDAFFRPANWLQLAGGVELRANSHDQVRRSWNPDFHGRGLPRPAWSVRHLSATFTRSPLTVHLGKQVIRWGRTDLLTPTDRFAPRDYLSVVDTEFLPVTGARAHVSIGSDSVEAVWVPYFTPSRLPLLDQRWAAPSGDSFTAVEVTRPLPEARQTGVRWSHRGDAFELALSIFDGFNHLPNIEVGIGRLPAEIEIARHYPRLRSYGAEVEVLARLFTVKGETAYFASPERDTDEYLLYVVQIERQRGEWLIIAGYAGEVVTTRRARLTFAPDRGLTRALVARASYSVDANRSVALETAVRQNGRGVYGKAEFSEGRGEHWRVTLSGTIMAGEADDFLGQYRRNSHLRLGIRYSF